MSLDNQYRKDNDAIHLGTEVRQRIICALAEAESKPQDTHTKPYKKPRMSYWVRAMSAAACILVLMGGFGVWSLRDGRYGNLIADETTMFAEEMTTYEDIYDLVWSITESRWAQPTLREALAMVRPPIGGNWAMDTLPGTDVTYEMEMLDVMETPSRSSRAEDTAQEGGGARGYSKTNVQIEGVDEADIVKTDGEHLYIIAGNRLIIAKADGEQTHIITKMTINQSDEGHSRMPLEMFLQKDRLIILISEHEYIAHESPRRSLIGRLLDIFTPAYDFAPSERLENTRARTFAVVYDISNPLHPLEVGHTGQDGEYLTSRMQGEVVYVVTTHTLREYPKRDNPQTFVPSLFTEGVWTPLSPNRIVTPSMPKAASYTVITSMSVDSGKQLDGQSFFGNTSTVYMNFNSLIIAQSIHEEKVLETSRENGRLIEHRFSGFNTHLSRFSIDKGDITLTAQTQVPGKLLNQFSLDEHQGAIRIVTTTSHREYKTHEEDDRRFMSHEGMSGYTDANALYILDLNGEVIGEITDLAENEDVYSVRFAGNIGYFVTFRQIDPLFTVDLSDPRNPKVLSELKIPGFSQYLHVYGNGLLFGLGMDADEQTGRTNGMKMSMFDISDPTDVSERHVLLLDSWYSEALSNHKAILVLPHKNLIAFPADNGYTVYGYSDENGFYKRGVIELGRAWNARGVLIDDLLYMCTAGGIDVFDLEDFTQIADIRF